MEKAERFWPLNGALVIGYDFTNGKDKSVLCVGVRELNGTTTVVNAFQGEEAEALFKKLTEPKKKEN